jgi:hypothetical protein
LKYSGAFKENLYKKVHYGYRIETPTFMEVVFLSMPSYIHISIDGKKEGMNLREQLQRLLQERVEFYTSDDLERGERKLHLKKKMMRNRAAEMRTAPSPGNSAPSARSRSTFVTSRAEQFYGDTLGLKVQTRNGQSADMANLLNDGVIDAFCFGAGIPIPAFSDLDASQQVVFFTWTDAELASMEPVISFTAKPEDPATDNPAEDVPKKPVKAGGQKAKGQGASSAKKTRPSSTKVSARPGESDPAKTMTEVGQGRQAASARVKPATTGKGRKKPEKPRGKG